MTRARIALLTTERGALTASATEIRELAEHTLALHDKVQAELDAHADAIRRGVEAARADGRHIGRPRKEVDVDRAVELFLLDWSLKRIARELCVDRNTLRRRLAERGMFGR